MPTEVERLRAGAVVVATERLVAEMKAAGERDPIGVLRAVQLLTDLKGAVETPLLFPLEDPRALQWAEPLRALLVTHDVGDGILARRLFAHAIEIVGVFQPADA